MPLCLRPDFYSIAGNQKRFCTPDSCLIMKKVLILTSVVLVLLLPGCRSLKTVNEYAQQADSHLATFEAINLRFADGYRQARERTAFAGYGFDTKPVIPPDFDAQFAVPDSVVLYTKADSTFAAMLTVLREYFAGLAQLSSNKLVSFAPKQASLSATLQNAQVLGLTTTETTAYQNLLNRIVTASLTGLQHRKTAEYITDAQPALLMVLTALQRICDRMMLEVGIRQDEAYTGYSRTVARSNTPVPLRYEQKLTMAQGYLREKAVLQAKVGQLKKFKAGIELIKTAHTDLFEKKNRLSDAEVRELVLHTTSELKLLKADVDAVAH